MYARVSSARQKKDETIASQTAALRVHAQRLGLEVPDEWVFEDEGHSGATLVRPALERLRDLVAGVGIDVVVCYSPDRLARKFAYQALLIEEFTRAGTRVEFVKGPRGDSPEDQLLVQFQGMFAEYEKAQIMERYRRGKAHRARTGSINVLSGAPFGYRYVGKSAQDGSERPPWPLPENKTRTGLRTRSTPNGGAGAYQFQICHQEKSRVGPLPFRYGLFGKFFTITRSASSRRSFIPSASYAFTRITSPSSFAGACGYVFSACCTRLIAATCAPRLR